MKTYTQKDDMRTPSLEEFGKDHWSTFAYLETRIVDYKGEVDTRHMRKDGSTYPTILKGYFLDNKQKDISKVLIDHNDYDCLHDLEHVGLLENTGTGLYPVVKLTPLGIKVASQLRVFKAGGGSFAFFSPTL